MNDQRLRILLLRHRVAKNAFRFLAAGRFRHVLVTPGSPQVVHRDVSFASSKPRAQNNPESPPGAHVRPTKDLPGNPKLFLSGTLGRGVNCEELKTPNRPANLRRRYARRRYSQNLSIPCWV